MTQVTNFLALDVGSVRIGLAGANSIVRIAHPLATLTNDESFLEKLTAILAEEQIGILVVGLPRNLDGDSTPQTDFVEAFVTQLEPLGLPIYFQDEALTSSKAEAELESRGKPFEKGDVDALAATYILDDFLQTHKEPEA
jgi:putative Holliday junction resolvase